MMIVRKIIDYLQNATVLGGAARHRIIEEVAEYLRMSPIAVYNTGRAYYDAPESSDVYGDKRILCRYAYVSTSPLKRCNPLYDIVKAGKVLDYGSGIGVYFDEIRTNPQYEKHFLDVPGPAFDFVKHKYASCHFHEAPCEDWGQDYDLIVMTDVLEHLEDPCRSLGKVLESLKVGGRLLYYFSENREKAGHLANAIDMKPQCDLMLSDACERVRSLEYLPGVDLWQKKTELSSR